MTLHVWPYPCVCLFFLLTINSQFKALHEVIRPLGLSYFYRAHTDNPDLPVSNLKWFLLWLFVFLLISFFPLKRVRTTQIENLQEQLRDKEKQMSGLKERVKSLQADTTNTDTALTTLEEALAEKVGDWPRLLTDTFLLLSP